MCAHSVSLPKALWPEDLRARFDSHPLTPSQRTRLQSAMGRWLKLSRDAGLDAREVSRDSWLARTGHLPIARRNAVRQALALAFPEAGPELYSGLHTRVPRDDQRSRLVDVIGRNLERFPPTWRDAAVPLLCLDETGAGDGILVQAWAHSTIVRRVQAAAVHFDFCRENGLAVDVTPASIRAWLRQQQARVSRDERRIGGVGVDLAALTGLALAIHPTRSWGWLKTARDRVKKVARHHGARSAGRAIDAAELRAAGQQLLDKADFDHVHARHHRDFVKAHSKARTAVTMILLSEAPIRITSCAEVELHGSLLADLSGLYLDPASTKESDTDRREFSKTLIDALGRYLRLHRAVIAAPGETRLLVGERGGPIRAAQLSKWLGDITAPVFGVRVTPHAIRHSVGNFIVARAPEEAALASLILNHRTDGVTPVYTQRAGQIAASRRLAAASRQTAEVLGAQTSPTRNRPKVVRGRKAAARAHTKRRAIQAG